MTVSKIVDAGPVAILSAVLLILALIGYDWVKGRKWKTPNGDRRAAVRIDCPNKAPDLVPALRALTRTLDKHTESADAHSEMTRNFGPIAQRIDSGVDRLLEQVKPGSRREKVSEESRDMLVELVAGQKTSTALMRELVNLARIRNGKP